MYILKAKRFQVLICIPLDSDTFASSPRNRVNTSKMPISLVGCFWALGNDRGAFSYSENIVFESILVKAILDLGLPDIEIDKMTCRIRDIEYS